MSYCSTSSTIGVLSHYIFIFLIARNRTVTNVKNSCELYTNPDALVRRAVRASDTEPPSIGRINCMCHHGGDRDQLLGVFV